MTVFQDKLNALRDSLNLKIALDAPAQIGQPAVARIENLPASLSLVDVVTEIVESKVQLTWLTKDVMFGTDDLAPAMRAFHPDLTTLNSLVTGPKTVFHPGSLLPIAGTPGLVGQLVGGIPIPTTVTTEIPVSVSVEWQALDHEDKPLKEVKENEEGGEFKNLGTARDRAAFLFVPRVEEDQGTTVPPTIRKMRATVTLTAKIPAVPPTDPPTPPATITASVSLTVSVPVPALQIPTVIALFVHAGFDLTTRGGTHGNVLLLLPPESPYRSLASLLGVVGALSQALDLLSVNLPSLPGLGSLGFFAGMVVRFARTLTALADPASPATFLVLASGGEPKLSRFEFPINGQGANDTFGSLLLLGMPGKGAMFFNAEEHKEDEGVFGVAVVANGIAAAIPSLHDLVAPRSQPKSIPENSTFLQTPTREDENFGNRISSFALL
ncbi:MAG TPA: hypothetical protein VF756_18175 [Thermoanaerobaculia bacterium]